jgi:hypothetical protein
LNVFGDVIADGASAVTSTPSSAMTAVAVELI